MTAFKEAANATTFSAAIHPKTYSPVDIAALSSCVHMFVGTSAYSTIVMSGSDSTVSVLSNLKTPSQPMSQTTASRRPFIVTDDVINREVMSFGVDKTNELVMSGSISYTSAFSMFCLLRMPITTATTVAMGQFVSAPNQAYIGGNSLGNLYVNFGSAGTVLAENPGDEWRACWMIHDGAGNIGLKTGADDVTYDPYSAVSTTTSLRFGHNPSTQGFTGKIAMGAFFNVDLTAVGNEVAWSKARKMIDRYCRNRVAV